MLGTSGQWTACRKNLSLSLETSVATIPENESGKSATNSLVAGQRLYCPKCASEVEIVNPCPSNPAGLVLQCCGQAMVPVIGLDVHVGVE
ncbi:MAG: hypothetical protein NVSMB9_05910 [Isosphaeraceae bacterium]